MQLINDLGLQVFGRACTDLEAYHLAAAAALKGGFKLAHQIFGLFLKFQIAVAQNAEKA